MANPEHLAILDSGIQQWNEWRSKHPEIMPDLRDTNFIGRSLMKVNFNMTYLSGANLSGADLSGANLGRAYLSGANLTRVNFNRANLGRVVLTGSNLIGSSFHGADLSGVNFTGANLTGADFSAALLFVTIFSAPNIRDADFTGAHFLGTFLAFTDLSEVKGLQSVIHLGPCSIDIDTIFRSKGKIPKTFLRGCGVPEIFIEFAASPGDKHIEYPSCFISYSSKDKALADRLHSDLDANGVRNWIDSEDLKIGDKLRTEIDKAIHGHEKLLLLLSKDSVASTWVENEVETAFEKEINENKTVFFPISLDNAVMEVKAGWAAQIRRRRHIGDFTQWKTDHDAYQKSFARLLRDLKSVNGQPSK